MWEESPPRLFTWVLFASPSEYRLFTNFYTIPSSGFKKSNTREVRILKRDEGTAAFRSLLETKLEKSIT